MPQNQITTTFDRVWTTTRPDVMPKVWDNITADVPVLQELYGKGGIEYVDPVEGGAALDFNVLYNLPTSQGYTPGASTLTPVAVDPATRGRYEFKHIACPFKVLGPDIAKNAGPNQVANLMALIVDAVRGSMSNLLGGSNSGIWSNADENDVGKLTGLQNLVKVDSTNNALGTTGRLSRVTNSWWRNTIGTSISNFTSSHQGINRMRAAMFAASRGNEIADLIAGTSSMVQNLIADLTSTYYFNTPFESNVTSERMLDVGVGMVRFHGAKVVKDVNCPANEIRGLCTKYLKLRVSSARNLEFSDWVPMVAVGEDALAAMCLWMGNLGLTNLAQSWGISGGDTA